MSRLEVAMSPEETMLDRLARECAQLDRDFEKSLGEEGMTEDLAVPDRASGACAPYGHRRPRD